MKAAAFLPYYLLSLLAPVSVWASPGSYGATLHESRWVAEGSPIECALSHKIPGFGEARFSHPAAGQFGFVLLGGLSLPAGSTLQVDIVPPPWRHDRPSKQITSLAFDTLQPNLVLEEALAQRVFDELGEGMAVAFNYPDPVKAGARIEVSLSPVQFQRPLQEYKACVAALLPFTFDQLSTSRVFFPNNSDKLSQDSKQWLDHLATYLKRHKSVYKVRIEGHADSRGSSGYNYDLGALRARAVRKRLIGQGVPSGRFVLKSYGERRPGACRESEKDARDNRCAVIVLKRR